jgi:pSer/pThr/pTyr-binding forkhead associated (FHA) protein/S1-C subfamily serine protease
MKAQFSFLSGSRAGQTDIFSQPQVTIGRHPQSTLRFDPDLDLDVSGHHAKVMLEGSLYVLRDLGSTNGTLVNGKRITGDHVLVSGDKIRFGATGPEIQFTAIGESRTPRSAPAVEVPAPEGTVVFGSAKPAPPPLPPVLTPEQMRSPRRTPGPGATTRVRIEVQRQTKGLRRTAIGLFVLLVALSGALLWQSWDTGQQLAAQRRALLGQVDSLVGEINSLSSSSVEMRSALDSARIEASQLQAQLNATSPDDAKTIADLRRRLDVAVKQQRTLTGVAQFDASAIAAKNQDAIAMVFVQFADGRIFTGTAFAVRSDPTGGLLITNRHVVTDSNGAVATRIGIVFQGTHQNFRADLVRVHASADLALLRTTVHKGFPVVEKLGDSNRVPAIGTPAAILGFPLGLDVAGGSDWGRLGVAATLTLGTVARTLPDLVQLDSYGAQGSSGSPIFDRQGQVIAVLYGGQPGSNGRIIYSVPVRQVQELLAAE